MNETDKLFWIDVCLAIGIFIFVVGGLLFLGV